MPITIFPENILESGTVTVTGDPDTGHPEERLFDRSINLKWKYTGTQATTFLVDYGSAVAIDTLFIAGHNFDGEDMQFQYSTDNFSADTNDAVTDWTQSGNAQIEKEMSSSQTKRYWRVTVTSMTDPECCEVYISKGYDFTVAGEAEQAEAEQSNVERFESVGGMPRTIKYGDTRKLWEYTLVLSSATELANWRTVITELDGLFKPVLIKDLDGNFYLMELLEDPVLIRRPNDRATVTLRLLEIL